MLPPYASERVDEDFDSRGFIHQQEESGKMWSKYLVTSEKYDKDLVENWKGDADGILIFTGLFSAVVSAFIVESYKSLQPDPGQTTTILLSQLVALSNGTETPVPTAAPFIPSASSVRVNVLWFLSLCTSLTCALGATLMQRWARNYLRFVQTSRSDPHAQAFARTWAFEGILSFQMPEAMEMITSLLHVSLFLFFTGLLEFIFSIHHTVAFVTLAFVVSVVAVYATLTVLPIFFHNCPFQTPLSSIIWRVAYVVALMTKGLLRLLVTIAEHFQNWRGREHELGTYAWASMWLDYYPRKLAASTLAQSIEEAAVTPDVAIARTTMRRQLESLQSREDDEYFFEGLAAFTTLSNHPSVPFYATAYRPTITITNLMENNSKKIVQHVLTLLCRVGQSGMSDAARRQRILTATRAIWQLSYSTPLQSFYPYLNTWFSFSRKEVWLSMMAIEDRVQPPLAVTIRCILAWIAWTETTRIESTDQGKMIPALDEETYNASLVSLLRPPDTLLEEVSTHRDMRRNGALVNLVGILSDLLPHLQLSGLTGERAFLWVWDLLRLRTDGLRAHLSWLEDNNLRPSHKVRDAFEDMFLRLTRLSDTFPVSQGTSASAVNFTTPGHDTIPNRFEELATILHPIHSMTSRNDAGTSGDTAKATREDDPAFATS